MLSFWYCQVVLPPPPLFEFISVEEVELPLVVEFILSEDVLLVVELVLVVE
jgi:hypothetical protein